MDIFLIYQSVSFFSYVKILILGLLISFAIAIPGFVESKINIERRFIKMEGDLLKSNPEEFYRLAYKRWCDRT